MLVPARQCQPEEPLPSMVQLSRPACDYLSIDGDTWDFGRLANLQILSSPHLFTSPLSSCKRQKTAWPSRKRKVTVALHPTGQSRLCACSVKTTDKQKQTTNKPRCDLQSCLRIEGRARYSGAASIIFDDGKSDKNFGKSRKIKHNVPVCVFLTYSPAFTHYNSGRASSKQYFGGEFNYLMRHCNDKSSTDA